MKADLSSRFSECKIEEMIAKWGENFTSNTHQIRVRRDRGDTEAPKKRRQEIATASPTSSPCRTPRHAHDAPHGGLYGVQDLEHHPIINHRNLLQPPCYGGGIRVQLWKRNLFHSVKFQTILKSQLHVNSIKLIFFNFLEIKYNISQFTLLADILFSCILKSSTFHKIDFELGNGKKYLLKISFFKNGYSNQTV